MGFAEKFGKMFSEPKHDADSGLDMGTERRRRGYPEEVSFAGTKTDALNQQDLKALLVVLNDGHRESFDL